MPESGYSMRTGRKSVLLLILFASLLYVGCERKVAYEIIDSNEPAGFVGSAVCSLCHAGTYETFKNTGHTFILNKAGDISTGKYFPDFVAAPPVPPPGTDWPEISYVLGGFRWKANFIDLSGYFISGEQAQWNSASDVLGEPAQWVPFQPDEPSYDCAQCHTTGYVLIGNQGGLPGIRGRWSLPGVQCEQCHGAGGKHIFNPFVVKMKVDVSSETCRQCHRREETLSIPAKGGFIEPYTEGNEVAHTGHKTLECTFCHNPHVSLHPNNPDRSLGIISTCENCHFDTYSQYLRSGLPHSAKGVRCIDCHMPFAVKSAVGDSLLHTGDTRSHLIRINTDPQAELINADTANGYLTLDYVCLTPGCHSDESRRWTARYASQIHPGQSSTWSCFNCHDYQDSALITVSQQWDCSPHASAANIIWNRSASPAYEDCEKCHTNEGFIAATTGPDISSNTFTRIACFTCHAPHLEGPLELRLKGLGRLSNGTLYDFSDANTCGFCHQSTVNVSSIVVDDIILDSAWGPHYATQTDMFLGTNGYEYPGFVYSSSFHTFAMPDGCIECHMTEVINTTGGHTVNMRDANTDFENLTGCNAGAHCHNGTLTTFDRLAAYDLDWDGNIEGVRTEITGLLDSLNSLLENAGLLVASTPAEGLPVSYRDSAGALFNYLFVSADRSRGIHNTQYSAQLLRSAINYLASGNPNGPGLPSPQTTRSMKMSH
jgi:hypothetical protein